MQAGRLLPFSVPFVILLAACGPGAQPSASTGAPAPAAPTAAATKLTAAPTPAAAAPSPAAAAPSPSAGAAITISGSYPGEARSLNAAGGTFPAPLYQKWFDQYNTLTGVQVNYQAIGSGGGIQGIQDQTIDFGASDAPMTDEQMVAAKGGPILHIPTALGAIVLTYNIPEVASGTRLKLTPDTIAGIFLGTIQKWNDPALVADNPSLANVNQDIVVVHRSDGSGTTYGFTDYLSTVSPPWAQQVGRGTSVNWPTGLGGSGNPGVAGEVQQTPYSVGYVELIYALQNNLGYGTVRNRAAQFVDPSLDSVTSAAAASAGSIPPDLRFSIVDASGDTSYPICTATWILTYRNQTDQAKALAITRLLWWATHAAQQDNNQLHYATVPPAITAISEQFIRAINVGGTPIFPGR